MTLREQIESLAESIDEECSRNDAHEDSVSKLASHLDEVSRDLIAAIANGEIDTAAEIQELCAQVRDANDAIGEALEGMKA